MHDSTGKKRSRASLGGNRIENPYGYDPDLPVLAGDPRLNPGKGIGINWHPSQPVRNTWSDWASADRQIFDFRKARMLPVSISLVGEAAASRLSQLTLDHQYRIPPNTHPYSQHSNDNDITLSELGDSIISTNYPETLSSMLPSTVPSSSLTSSSSSSSFTPPFIHSSYGRMLPSYSTYVDPNDPKYQHISLPLLTNPSTTTSSSNTTINPGNYTAVNYPSSSTVPSIDWNALGLGHAFHHSSRSATNTNHSNSVTTSSPSSKRIPYSFRLKSSSINPNNLSNSYSSSSSSGNHAIPEHSAYSTDMEDETYGDDDEMMHTNETGSHTGVSNSFYNSNNPSRNSYNHNQATADEVTLISSSRHSPSLSLSSSIVSHNHHNHNNGTNEELKARPTRRSRVNSDHTTDGLFIHSNVTDNQKSTNTGNENEDSMAGSAFTKTNASGGPSCCDMGFAHEYMKLRDSKKNITASPTANLLTDNTMNRSDVVFPLNGNDFPSGNTNNVQMTDTVRNVPVPLIESTLPITTVANNASHNNSNIMNNVRHPIGKKVLQGPPGVILPILSIVDQQRIQQPPPPQVPTSVLSSNVHMDIEQSKVSPAVVVHSSSFSSYSNLSSSQPVPTNSLSVAATTGTVFGHPVTQPSNPLAIASFSSTSALPPVSSLLLPPLASRYTLVPYTRPRVNGTVTGETDEDDKPSNSTGSRVTYSNKVLNRRIESSPAAIALLAAARNGGKAAIAKLTEDQRRVLKMERAKLNKRKCRAIERAYESGLLLQVHILERVNAALQHMFTSPVVPTTSSTTLTTSSSSSSPLIFETLLNQLWKSYQSLISTVHSSSVSLSFPNNHPYPSSKALSILSSSLLRIVLGIVPPKDILSFPSSSLSTAFQQFCTTAMNYQLPTINDTMQSSSTHAGSNNQPTRSSSNTRAKSRPPPPPPTRVSVRAASRQRNAVNSTTNTSTSLLANDLMMDGNHSSSFSLFGNDNATQTSSLSDVLTTTLPAFTLGDMGVKEVTSNASSTTAGAFATLDDTALVSLSNNGPLPTPGLPVVILPAGDKNGNTLMDESETTTNASIVVVPPSNPLYHVQSLLRVHHNQRDRLPGLYHRNNLDRSLSINSLFLPRLTNNSLGWLMQEVQRMSTQADAFSILSFAATMPNYSFLPSYATVSSKQKFGTDPEIPENSKATTTKSDIKNITSELASILQLSDQQRHKLNQTLTPTAVRTERGWTRRAQVSLDYTVRVISSLRKDNLGHANTPTNTTNSKDNENIDTTPSANANDDDEVDDTTGGGVSASSAAIQASNSLFAQLTVLTPSQRERFCAWLATQPIVKAEGPSTLPPSALPFNTTMYNHDVPEVSHETAIHSFAQKYTRPGLCIDLGGYSFMKNTNGMTMNDTSDPNSNTTSSSSSSTGNDPFFPVDPTIQIGIDIDTELDYIFGAHLLSLTEQRQSLASLKPSAPVELLGTQGYGSRVPVKGTNYPHPQPSPSSTNGATNNGTTHAAMAAF